MDPRSNGRGGGHPVESPGVSDATPTIAIVDDEEPVRAALRRLLMSAGFATTEFATGAGFVAAVEGLRPAVVVLDLHLPQMDGFMVVQRLRTPAVPSPVIVITGDLAKMAGYPPGRVWRRNRSGRPTA